MTLDNAPTLNNIGGLSHLVEAASALTKLVSSPSNHSTEGRRNTSTQISDDDDERERRGPSEVLSKREIFPQRLLAILSDSSLSDVISWLPHGRSFVIFRPDVFAEKVMPKYLAPADPRGSVKYPSFTRKLNRWGFRQATRGPDSGAFHHPLFRRDQPEACLQMVCQKSRKRQDPTVEKRLPPKKRAVVQSKSPVLAEHHSQTIPFTGQAVCTPASSFLMSVSPGPSTTGMHVSSEPTVVSLESRSSHTRPALPLPSTISQDAALVAAALRQRDQAEHLKVAQAMLFHAYTQALKECSGGNR